MHSYTFVTSIAAKVLRHPGGQCTSIFAGTPKIQASSTVFDPPQLHERDATEPHIWPNVYLADALLRKPIRIVRSQPEQSVAWPKHGDASCSHGTFHPACSRVANPWDLLQVTGPFQCPRVDEPHPASIACARPPVAGSARKGVAQAVRDSTGVTYRHQRKFAQDTLNWNDVQDRLLVVKLVYHTRSHKLQPSYKKSISINAIICISYTITMMCIILIITIFRIIMFPGLKRGRNRRTWIQCRSFQRQRTGATHEHTRQSLATRRRLHYRCPAAESWRGPCDDFHGTISTETDCSKPAALPCTWCAPAPNNWTVWNGPCVLPIFAAPMLQGGQLPDNISSIICIRRKIRIILTGIKIIFRYFSIEWLLPPLDLEPRSANHISTVLTTRPIYNAKRHATMVYIQHYINRSHVDDAIFIISIISIINIKRLIAIR